MNIQTGSLQRERRTTADDVFDQLRSDIVNLRLLPGTKMSEVEVAGIHGTSRQPVREAFIRLNNIKLLHVRPQKATLVRKISNRDLLDKRFIRTAVEVEIVQRACVEASSENLRDIEQNLAVQRGAVDSGDGVLFHDLDYKFHELLCVAANCDFAFETISENKSHVDRLCLLSLSHTKNREELYVDHVGIFEALKNRDSEKIVALTRDHLSRLDATLNEAYSTYPDYFED